MAPLKIAITQSNLTLRGGAERVVLKVAQHYRAPIYVAEYDREGTFDEFGKLDVRVIPSARLPLPYGRASQGLRYGMAFRGLKLGDEFDMVNAHMAPSQWASNRNDNVVWYCHTPLRDVYDLYHYRMSMRRWYARPLYAGALRVVRSMDQGAVRRIGTIMANSANVKRRIERYYGRDDAIVVNGGVDYRNYRDRGDGRYFFYPSRISPNKRQDFAIEAFNMFSRRVKGYKLIILGPVSRDRAFADYYDYIKRLAASSPNRIEIMEGATDAELSMLYSRCTAVLYPPINEDFGLVPLEAMASGKPVIAADGAGPRETIAKGTGYLVKNPMQRSRRMESVTDRELASRIGRVGRKRVVEHYSWGLFFKRFDAVLARAADGFRGSAR